MYVCIHIYAITSYCFNILVSFYTSRCYLVAFNFLPLLHGMSFVLYYDYAHELT
jgi:hypothetical protein